MSNFTLAILEFTDEISVISREQKYINRFKPLLHFCFILIGTFASPSLACELPFASPACELA
jgi:hypothetical protein